SYQGPGGGGGRVAVYYGDATNFDLASQVVARGGAGFSTATWGGAGTVYLKQAAASLGEFIVDNTGAPEGNVAVTEISGAINEPIRGSSADITVVPGTILNGLVDLAGTDIDVSGASFSNSVYLSGTQINAVGSTFTGATDLSATQIDVSGASLSGDVYVSGSAISGAGASFTGSIYLSATQFDASAMVFSLNELVLSASSELSNAQAVDAGSDKIEIQANRIEIDATSKLDVSNKGLAFTGSNRAGGSYGGRGGLYTTGVPNATFGDYWQPTDFGVGGYSGPLGGGSAKLVVTQELVLDGQILARGQSYISATDAGGSGGSLWLDVASIRGTGSIDAGGGDGWQSASTRYQGPGGGGGRVAVYYGDATNFDLATQVLARGGAGFSNATWGGAGTIYLKQSSSVIGDLVVDNSGYLADNTAEAEISGIQVNDRLIVRGAGSEASLIGSTTEVFDEILLQQGGILTHATAVDSLSPGLDVQVRRMEVDSVSKLDISGRGLVFSGTSRAGGSYGGRGGIYTTGISNNTYGDYRQPVDFGAGGYSGPLGGGAAKLVVTEELVLDGQILSRGQSYISATDAGGSGGSLWLDVASIRGTGSIDAGGGDGWQSASTSYQGPGGGGGRVAVYYGDATNFDLASQVVARGGAGFSTATWGGAGTV
ncbi:MAG: hypothetical protein GY802_23010, partial [Gammaproteobacteria bacterium]|nr:hypothetical protein [Gammaproteobacteria bacterium]